MLLLAQGKYDQSVLVVQDSANYLYDPTVQTSIELPYFESFDSLELNPKNRPNVLWGIEYYQHKHGQNYWFENVDGNSTLALQVFPKDIVAMGGCASLNRCPELDTLACCNYRDRCEAKIYPNHFDESYFYGWDFMIPTEFEFQAKGPDEENEGKKTRHFIAQWSQAHLYETTRRDPKIKQEKVKWKFNQKVDCNGRTLNLRGKPTITFNLMHDDKDTDRALDLVISYGTQYNFHWLEDCIPDTNSRHGGRQYTIKNLVKRGEWVSILTEINWSENIDEGYMKLWVNDVPLKLDPHEEKQILIESDGKEPDEIFGANLYVDIHGFPQPNYLKLGHYRSNMAVPHTIFIDNFQITNHKSDLK
jgi:hypothetical protein